MASTTTIINFKADHKLKQRAQKMAEKHDMTLSSILMLLLRNYVETGYVPENPCIYGPCEHEARPSKRLLKAMRDARKEYKEGKTSHFESGEEAVAYLRQMVVHTKKRAKRI